VPITVVDGVADVLPTPDDAYDAAVAALVLCTVPNQATALAELRRVLRPGGQLRFFEHIAAEHPGTLRRVQRLADATLWPRLLGGCHTGRDTLSAITAAGFTLDEVHRFPFPASGPPGPATPHVRGTATLPALATPR
jgi:ubiquinone/menaquinone biosynthesis C-methylase UbiE